MSGVEHRADGQSQSTNPRARPLRRTDLVAHLREHFAARGVELTRADAVEFFDELFRLCVQQLVDTGEFSLPRLVQFTMKERVAYTARNPSTGEAIEIPASLVVRVRPAGQLRKLMRVPR